MESHSLLLGCSWTSTPQPKPSPTRSPSPPLGCGPGPCPHQCQSRRSDLMLSFSPSSLGFTGGQKSKVPFIQNSMYLFSTWRLRPSPVSSASRQQVAALSVNCGRGPVPSTPQRTSERENLKPPKRGKGIFQFQRGQGSPSWARRSEAGIRCALRTVP